MSYRETLDLTYTETTMIRLHGLVARLYLQLDKGWQFIKQILSLFHITSKTRRLIRIAEIFEIQGEPAMAVDYYRKALAGSPNRALLYLGMGRSYLRLFDLDKSRECIDRFLEKKPVHPEGTLYKGILLYYGGEFAKALDYLKKAEELLPAKIRKTALALEYIGECQRKLGNLSEAIRHMEAALEMDPYNAKSRSFMNLGELHFLTGNKDKALDYYRNALKLEAENSEIWNDLGVILHNMEQKEQSLECFNKAVALRPGFTEAINNLAAVREELGILEAPERERRIAQKNTVPRTQRRLRERS